MVYNLVLRVLPVDITTIGRAQLRLGKSYLSVLFGIQESIAKELGSVQKRMRQIGGKLIEEKQEVFVRLVTSPFKAIHINIALEIMCFCMSLKTIFLFLNFL
ncbi:hypothetical protein PP175_13605 [Aneurinibacillus sp. Ricciae_BoGa-3]|uniref:hypothetical protein n=1 Tax=Aneurinibacillus sp. Ricciae_BoGa-3 TaxID=3022697 RepID=UPI002340B174|nr:hypothetical protein [Aneurinibacillus sp. Ricciae_BoGa-3]WCK52491.1 hypothetical protein PP175_13605 [Aneurinibacillus sp. Ricciae_BoGa-3]